MVHINHALGTYRRPLVRRTCLSGRACVVVGTHEKLHAHAGGEIDRLLDLREMATPTTLVCHPLRQPGIFRLRRPILGVRTWHTHDGKGKEMGEIEE